MRFYMTTLNSAKLSVLRYLLHNDEELIIEFAQDQGIKNSLATIGVLNYLLADPENFSALSSAQKYHYATAIEPLVTDVPCDGMVGTLEDGSSSCRGDTFIDDDSLLRAFQLEDMRCQICVYDKESWYRNNR